MQLRNLMLLLLLRAACCVWMSFQFYVLCTSNTLPNMHVGGLFVDVHIAVVFVIIILQLQCGTCFKKRCICILRIWRTSAYLACCEMYLTYRVRVRVEV
jgi:hypothetical protein